MSKNAFISGEKLSFNWWAPVRLYTRYCVLYLQATSMIRTSVSQGSKLKASLGPIGKVDSSLSTLLWATHSELPRRLEKRLAKLNLA